MQDTIQLDDLAAIKNIDKQGILQVLKDFPRQLNDAQDIAEKAVIPQDYKNIENIVFVGMGGSAIGADLLRSLLFKEINIPINVIRGYELPGYVNNKTLTIMCSYSGDTEETLACFREAKQKSAKIISVSCGGILESLSKELNLTFIKIPTGYQPRCALGYLSVVPLIVLNKLGLISSKRNELKEAAILLNKLYDDEIGAEIPIERNRAKKIAKEIKGKYAVIYGSSPYLDSVVMRFRGQIAENAKHLSSSHMLPEMNHNEIVGWQNPKDIFNSFVAIFIRDRNEHPRIKQRIDITKALIEKENVKTLDIYSCGDSLLARIFSLIYIVDFISFYLAVLNNVDPAPVNKISYLKEELAKF